MNGWLLRVRMCHVGAGAVVSQLGFPSASMVTQPPGITGFSGIFGGSSDPTTLFLAFLFAGTLWLVPRLTHSSTRKLPPGLRGLPLIGDVLHITDQECWLYRSAGMTMRTTPCLQFLVQIPAHAPFR